MWWFEPTAGYSYSYGMWSDIQRALGFQDNEVTRVQGGARAGTSMVLGNGVTFEPTFLGLVYSDVRVIGTSQAAALGQLPSDQGKIWGKGDVKFNFLFADNWSAYIEGEIHGTNNDTGGSGTVGVRKSW